MKKTLKMAVSGVLALTIAGGIATSASAAATSGSLVMYHNIQGGPSKLTDSCTLAKNTIDTLYYVDCTYLYNAKPFIHAGSIKIKVIDAEIINLYLPNAGSIVEFTSELNTTDISNYSRANINIYY